MKRTKEGLVIPLVIIVLALAVGGGSYVYFKQDIKKSDTKEESSFSTEKEKEQISKEMFKKESKGKCGFNIIYPTPNSKVVFPLKIKGTIDKTNKQSKECPWQTSEGVLGTAQLYFNYNDEGWKPAGAPVVVVTKSLLAFDATLNFNNDGIGLPSNVPMKIVFTEENPAVVRPSLTFELPIIFTLDKESSLENIVTPAYLKSIENNKITLDYFEILYGTAAEKAAVEDGVCTQREIDEHDGCFPNGDIYDRNRNTKLRTFELSPNIIITTATAFSSTQNGIRNISVEELKKDYIRKIGDTVTSPPYQITVKDGLVTKIVEIYRP